jgi:predicted TIM-barrel fold metal-dependent hydrolase
MNTIDAHVHVWTDDLERYPLAEGYRREDMRPPTFTPEELFAHCRPVGVDRIVLIQMSFYGFDNSYLLDAMRAYPGVFSGVAVIDSHAPHPEEEMRRLAGQGVRGFRIAPRGAPPETWLDGPGFAAMFAAGATEGLALCPLINPSALPALDRMCERFPDTPVVIDHLGLIGATGSITDADVDALGALSRHANVFVKVSAFYALGAKKPPHDDLIPLIRRVYEDFGAARLMWASDCPYQVDRETYDDSLSLVRDRLDFLSDADREQILGGTAERVFFG